jgi:short-subunit dehydrogenase
MATNFWGALYTTMAVIPQMKRQRFGRIGNVVSLGGKIPVPHLLPYVTAKYALAGLTQGLRAELSQHNILVTGLYPPVMRTGGHTHAFIKGKHQIEHAMISVMGSVPGLSVSAKRVAHKFLEAIRNGDADLVVSWPAYFAVVLQDMLPNEMAEFGSLLSRVLPTAEGASDQAIQGRDVPGLAADLLNRAVPRAARPHNA